MKAPKKSSPHECTSVSRKGMRVETCIQVSPGDLVEARVGPTPHVQGQVVDVQPTLELFWVVSHDGTRRIVELSEFDVYFASKAPKGPIKPARVAVGCSRSSGSYSPQQSTFS